MTTFILSRLQSGTKTKLKQTNKQLVVKTKYIDTLIKLYFTYFAKQNKTQDKYFTTLRWLINAYVMSKLFSRLRKFSVSFNFVFFSNHDAFETQENIHHTIKFQTKQI